VALHFLLDDGPLQAGAGDDVVLTGAEAHHAATVRRVRVGEEVTLGDGRGAWLEAVVEAVAPREVTVRVRSREDVPAPTRRVVLVQALAKGDRDELAVQAATELGVDEIVPWQAARSISRWDSAKAAKGVARWQSIVREAAKQAHRAWVPVVRQPVTTAQLGSRSGLLLVLEPEATVALSRADLGDADELVLVVGPEGGIAPEELAALADVGAIPVRLGETVLRTSTAGPAALAVVSTLLGRW
jgi:16S rRNA (uracil1498-N3)-methyltransferase